MKVFFRVEGTALIGAGHVKRCTVLARKLKEMGLDAVFVTSSETASLFVGVLSAFELFRIAPTSSEDEDAALFLSAIGSQSAERCVVVDGYHLGVVWEKAVHAKANLLLAIDDIGRPHACDILLDANFRNAGDVTYTALIDSGTELLLGCRYCLLDDSFVQQQLALPEFSSRKMELLVCFGGSDPGDATLEAVKVLKKALLAPWSVHVVIGPGYGSSVHLRTVIAGDARFALSEDPPHFSLLMARASLSLGAGGTMLWERCAVGLPAVVLAIAENQSGAASALAATGAIVYVGKSEEVSADVAVAQCTQLMGDILRLEQMSAKCRSIVDGRGAERVVSALLSRMRE